MTKTLRSELIVLAVACGFLFLYLITTSQLFSFDAITNALACESNEAVRWFHSNHPLYPFIGVLWYRLEKLIGYTGYSIYSLARLNSILTASALGILMWAIYRWKGISRAVLTGLFLGTVYAVWAYAVDGRAVGASMACSSLVIVWMMKLERFFVVRIRHGVVLGLLSALTILMHAIAIFHCLPVFAWLFFKRRSVAIGYLFTVATLVGATYLGCYLYVEHMGFATSFFSWAVGYASYSGMNAESHSGFWANGFQSMLSGLWLGWRNALFADMPRGLVRSATSAAAVIVLGMYLVSFVKQARQRGLSLASTLFLWGLFVMVFLAVWSPGQEGFRLHVLIPWTVMLALSSYSPRWINWELGIGATLFFLVNFNLGIFPAASIRNNVGYQVLDFVAAHIKPNSLVLTGPTVVIPDIEVLRPYFFPQIRGGSLLGRLFAFHETSLDPLQQRLRELSADKNDLYFSDDLFDPMTWGLVDRQANLSANSTASFVQSFEKMEMLLLPNGRALFRVRPTSH